MKKRYHRYKLKIYNRDETKHKNASIYKSFQPYAVVDDAVF